MAGSHASSPTRNYGQPSINTAFAAETDRGTGKYQTVQQSIGTADATFYLNAPCNGRLAYAEITCLMATDGTETIALTLTNKSNSDAAMFATTLFDDEPALEANKAKAISLSTTAADLLVDAGDLLALAFDEGSGSTITGAVVNLYFETL